MNISFNMNINICVTTYFESKDSSQMGPGVDEPACLRYKIKKGLRADRRTAASSSSYYEIL